MTGKAGNDVGIDPGLKGSALDATRLHALVLLNEGSADAGELARVLNLSQSTVTAHLEEMLEAGLVEVAEEVPRRGEVVPRYRALVRAFWGDEEWAKLTVEERQRLTAWAIQLISADAAEAIAAGSFNARVDSHTSRTVSWVDEQGWRELTRIQAEALKASFTVQAESAERLAESGEEGIQAMSAMLCFEMPVAQRPEPK